MVVAAGSAAAGGLAGPAGRAVSYTSTTLTPMSSPSLRNTPARWPTGAASRRALWWGLGLVAASTVVIGAGSWV